VLYPTELRALQANYTKVAANLHYAALLRNDSAAGDRGLGMARVYVGIRDPAGSQGRFAGSEGGETALAPVWAFMVKGRRGRAFQPRVRAGRVQAHEAYC